MLWRRWLALGLLVIAGALPSVTVGQPVLLQLVFRVPDGSPIRSSPVVDIAKSVIYFGADDGNLYAIPIPTRDLPRPSPKWIFEPRDPDDLSKPLDTRRRRPIRVTPVIDEARNRIYIATDNGYLYAVDRDTGQPAVDPAFRAPVRPASIRVPPALDQVLGRLYVGADDRQISALDISNGSSAGVFNQPKGAIRAAPVIDFVSNAVYFGADDGKFYGIDRENITNPATGFKDVAIGNPVRGSPVIDIGGAGVAAAIYFGADNGFFYAIDRSGKELYKFETGGPIRTMAAIDTFKRAVYLVSDDGNLYALYRSDEKDAKGEVVRRAGTRRFGFSLIIDGNPNPLDGDLPRSSPVVDRRLGNTGTGAILVGSVDGNLYGIDPDTGRLRFAHSVPDAGKSPRAVIRTTPAIYVSGPGGIIDIYIGADDGGLYFVSRRP
ncbi:PQQ-binding-like beta-propeller repeat protein [Candidatus Acetothermia bacterium]|jgi:outer membrane protein assembly factor BamB|nr:PQQ-binding-like beta-propeller repeat protein [Candidatus Acetothermia bacterium]MCI2431667.1 PQQ-binding-like beta-propeller repeat protein [Candidatus Acetothermia bacterium]MCI2436383.1 PQQ-binding-like beta-propeller repeat protein [Candidatus Acetothermia bacterium]